MSYAAGVFLIIAAIAIITGAVLQVLQYRRGQHVISKRQLVMRLVTAALLLTIIVLIFWAALYQWPSPLAALIFWTALTLVAILVIFIALADLRQVEREKHLRQAELYRSIQRLKDPDAKSPGGDRD